MSFGNNLMKGFVRSAVNQVGRDGGRVISNKVYKDGHSIPIRKVGGDSSKINVSQNIQHKRREELDEYYKDKLSFSTILIEIVMLIGAFVLSFISFLYYGYMAYSKFTQITTDVYVINSVPVMVPDRRYKEGYRTEYKPEKQYFKVEATEGERKWYIITGVWYSILSLILASIGIPLVFAFFI